MSIDKNNLEALIRQIIQEELNKNSSQEVRHVDPSGVISVDPSTYTLEKFPFPVDAKRIWLKDIFSLSESPRIGCGIMEMDDTSLDWTLQYDEVDYVIEGNLDIIIDGRVVSAQKGQILLIPKGSKITFSAKGKARFMYVVYPANWADQ
jgi:ethanolamine utilization protein EutQ